MQKKKFAWTGTSGFYSTSELLLIHTEFSENKMVLRVFSGITDILYQLLHPRHCGNVKWRKKYRHGVHGGQTLLWCSGEVQAHSWAEVLGLFPSPAPPRTSRAAASWLQKQHNIWRGRLCIWQLCLTFISGGKSASIPCGHWLLEGCSHKQNAGGHLIFCLPSSPAPSKPNINTWNRDRSWQNVLKYKDVQKHHLHQHEPAILANLLALFEGGS